MAENLIAHGKGVLDAGFFADCRKKAVVWNNDNSIDFFAEIIERSFGDTRALAAFKEEWLGNDSDSETTQLFCNACNHRGSTTTSSSAESTGDEDHVCALDDFLDLVARLFDGTASKVGIHTGTQAASDIFANVNTLLGHRAVKILRISIDRNKIDTPNF